MEAIETELKTREQCCSLRRACCTVSISLASASMQGADGVNCSSYFLLARGSSWCQLLAVKTLFCLLERVQCEKRRFSEGIHQMGQGICKISVISIKLLK